MAFELFRLHLVGEAVRRRIAPTTGEARRLVDEQSASLLPVLEEILAEHPVILGDGRCRSRHGMAAFFPVLTQGRAVALSPLAQGRLLGPGGNGRVKVFLPLGARAQEEACQRMTSPATLAAPEARSPRVELSPDACVGLYLASLERSGQRGRAPLPGPREAWGTVAAGRLREIQRAHLQQFGALRGFFSGFAEVERAIDAGELGLNALVFVRHGRVTFSTVAGRCLVMALLPAAVPCEAANQVLDRRRQQLLLGASYEALGGERTAELAEAMETLGLRLATRLAFSIGAGDMVVPGERRAILDAAEKEVAAVAEQYTEGLITDGERYNKIVDIGAGAAEQMGAAVEHAVRRTPVVDPDTAERRLDPSTNPLFLLADAGVAGSMRELRVLSGMVGSVAKPNGEIHEAAVTDNLCGGLSLHACFAMATAGRAKRIEAGHWDAEGERVAELLLRALGGVRVVARDCGALGALPMRAVDDWYPLQERVQGRFAAATAKLLAREEVEEASEVAIRSPIFCEAEGGVCAVCCGLDPATRATFAIGEPVGLHAAHALVSKLDQVGTRRFHIGGGTMRGWLTACEAEVEGVVVLRAGGDEEEAIAALPGGERVVVSAWIDFEVVDGEGVTVACGGAPHGARVLVKSGERVASRQTLAHWEPYARSLLARRGGTVRWVGLVEGLTLVESLDEVTGLSRLTVVEPEGTARPRVEITGPDGAVLGTIELEAGDALRVGDGEDVVRGQAVAVRWSRSKVFAVDIEGRRDLMRILHGRMDDAALLSEIGGVVEVTRDVDRSATIVVRPAEGEPRRYTVEHHCRLLVSDGERVTPGARLSYGREDPGDIARILGPAEGALRIVDTIELVYRLFGVPIHPRHAELVAKALLRAVRIRDPGAGPWASGELAPRACFARVAEALAQKGLAPPSAEVAVTGLGVRVGQGPASFMAVLAREK
jgi:DNA-directed RNA polymerase subunit beta'